VKRQGEICPPLQGREEVKTTQQETLIQRSQEPIRGGGCSQFG
jgi:hypothetical protein